MSATNKLRLMIFGKDIILNKKGAIQVKRISTSSVQATTVTNGV
jgi:hypothetical protein